LPVSIGPDKLVGLEFTGLENAGQVAVFGQNIFLTHGNN
jgi:hypothetical protein